MIESIDNQKVKLLVKLKMAKYRKDLKRFVVEGAHLVDEARKAKLLIEAFSLDDKLGYTQISEAVMKKISSTDTVVTEIALCQIPDNNELSNKLLILDAIQDPGNMGALMRSAAAFGFKTIVLGKGSVDIYNEKVIRASQGAIFKLSFINADLLDFIPKLKDYAIYGTDVVNGITLDKIPKEEKIAIILGNEGNGVSEEVKKLAKRNLYIPMENTESLNVSVAGGIIMYILK